MSPFLPSLNSQDVRTINVVALAKLSGTVARCSYRPHVSLRKFRGAVTFTLRPTAVLVSLPNILSLSANLEMLGVHAKSVVALVQDAYSFGNRAIV